MTNHREASPAPLFSARPLGVAIFAVAFLLTAGPFVLEIEAGQPATDLGTGEQLVFALTYTLPLAAVGALIVARQPRQAVGWVMWTAGTLMALSLFGVAYGEPGEGTLPGADGLWAIAQTAWLPSVALTITLLPLLFPNGRPPTPRWRWVQWATVIGLLAFIGPVTTLSWIHRDRRLDPDQVPTPGWIDVVSSVGIALTTIAIPASILSLVARYRRSRGIERQQLKWFVYGSFAAVVGFASIFVGGWIPFWHDNLGLLGSLSLSVTIGLAILRHNLYDIDRLISRTLGYAVLTAGLAGAYLATVVLLQYATNPLTGGSDLAALVRPVRARVQVALDRRFYRRRYDAVRSVETFGTRLRDEIDLDALGGELRAAVHDTVQPASVGLWLRPAVPRGEGV